MRWRFVEVLGIRDTMAYDTQQLVAFRSGTWHGTKVNIIMNYGILRAASEPGRGQYVVRMIHIKIKIGTRCGSHCSFAQIWCDVG